MKTILLLTLSMLIFGCQDFRQQELSEGPVKSLSESQEQAFLLSSPDSINRGEFTLEKMLANLVVNVMAPRFFQFQKKVLHLSQSIETYCTAVDRNLDASDLKRAAQSQWKETMDEYHGLEMIKIGQFQSAETDFYSWPHQSNSCRVALELAIRLPSAGNNYELPETASLNGFDAAEFLLFARPSDHGCPANRINRLTSWLNMDLQTREKLHCQMLRPISKRLNLKAFELQQEWNLLDGNLPGQLLAGDIEQNIGTLSDLLQTFYDQITKDLKVGRPIGLRGCHNEVACPETMEHYFSDYALISIEKNIQFFQQFFNGITHRQEDGFGLDNLFREKGLSSLVSEINQKMEAILTRIETLKTNSFKEQIINKTQSCANDDEAAICLLYSDVKAFGDILKTDFLIALSELSIPKMPQGDGD